MATLVLGAAGAAIGGSIGGAILGVSAATIGGFIGSTIGSLVDSWIISSLAPTQRIEGARLDSLRITSSTEGAVIPRLYGRMRMGGNIIWATDFREETKTTTQGGGKGGGGGKVKTTEYLYYASFAVALCEGPITGIGRIWADGKPMDLSGVTWRWYPGDEAQTADPFIAAKMGAANTPAYRGTAYVVFEELALSTYGNRLPQLSFEVFRPLADPDTAEGLTRAVTMIPASGEFTYGRDPLAPIKDAVTADGDVVVPLYAEAFGFWLKAAFGAPTTTGAEAPFTHEFRSDSGTLPRLSIETGMPEVPRYAMYSGCVLDQITWQVQRSGFLTATARLVAQGETVGTMTSAGTPAALELKRFGHFNGSITRNGTPTPRSGAASRRERAMAEDLHSRPGFTGTPPCQAAS
ncbi:MAG: phage tail tube protein [Pseudomonadota bacterium]